MYFRPIFDLFYPHAAKPTFDLFLTYFNVFGVSGLLGGLLLLKPRRCSALLQQWPTASSWKATKEYLNQRVPKSEFFECAFGPLSSHPFPSFLPPLSPSGPVHSRTTSPLFTSPFIPPFLAPGKVRFRYPSDLGTL